MTSRADGMESSEYLRPTEQIMKRNHRESKPVGLFQLRWKRMIERRGLTSSLPRSVPLQMRSGSEWGYQAGFRYSLFLENLTEKNCVRLPALLGDFSADFSFRARKATSAKRRSRSFGLRANLVHRTIVSAAQRSRNSMHQKQASTRGGSANRLLSRFSCRFCTATEGQRCAVSMLNEPAGWLNSQIALLALACLSFAALGWWMINSKPGLQ